MMNHTANDRTPYTYLIRFPSLNQLYYGVRYGANCHPSELGVGYKSSSNLVKHLLEQHSDAIFVVRKIFDDVDKAKRWETRVLTKMNAAKHPSFLNKQNNWLYPLGNQGKQNPMYGLPGTMLGRKHTTETIKKMSESKIGKTWNTGKHNTEESKQKCRDSQLGAKSHRFKGYYHTPHGIFESSRLAAAQNLNHKRIQEWCLTPDKVVTKRHLKCAFLNEQHLGKTFRELGFWFEPH